MHLRSLSAPAFWQIGKKKRHWVVCPSPGPHAKHFCIPLLVLLRDLLKLVESAKEGKTVIKAGNVLVDKRVIKDHAFPLGFMDVIEIPKLGKAFRISIDKNGLKIVETKETQVKLCKIKGKTMVKGGKIQLNLHDGRNLLVAKDLYKVGDSLLLTLPDQKIKEHFKLEPGALAIITAGKNMGKLVKVVKLIRRRSLRDSSLIVCATDEGEKTFKFNHVFVVGKDKPCLTL